jgi:hypothetical protein
MNHLPTCPVCHEPVADQPAENWTSAYRGGVPWWHLANNRPICPDADGHYSQAILTEDPLPPDSDTSSWIDAMTDLFAVDGPYHPHRLGSAIAAAEHLNRWLQTATGPFSAPLTLPAASDIAALVGHLHRTTRLLARVQAQTGAYLLAQAQQTQLTDLDDSEVQETVADAADDIDAWLQDAADCSARSAQATGVAWSRIRTVVAALTGATSARRTDER